MSRNVPSQLQRLCRRLDWSSTSPLLGSRLQFSFIRQESALMPSFISDYQTPLQWRSAAMGPLISWAAGFAKGRGKTKEELDVSRGGESTEVDLTQTERLMQQALHHFQAELANIRSGRANPGLLEPIMVEVHNERLQLRNLGTVTQRTPHLLVISVFNHQEVLKEFWVEKDSAAVVKAVRESPLQLQARIEGSEIHVPVPRASVEMLQRMQKLVHQEAESAKGAVRSSRHKAMDSIKVNLKNKKDDRFRLEKEIQKLCDRYVGEIEHLKVLKDKDIKDNH